VRPVGGSQDVQLDLRLLTATHRDLPAMVAEGTFREDLYYRLAVIPLRLPSLRERGEDIMLLATHFLERAARLFAVDGALHRHFVSLRRRIGHRGKMGLPKTRILGADPLLQARIRT